MKRIIIWMLFVCLACGADLFAVVVHHTTTNAASFNFVAGTPDYSNDGMVAGASFPTPATGIANVALPNASVVKAFTVCGRDFANDQEFAGALKRKTIDPANSAFTSPEVISQVHSGLTSSSDSMQCLNGTIDPTKAKIDNTKWTYFAEITIGNTTELIAVKIDY